MLLLFFLLCGMLHGITQLRATSTDDLARLFPIDQEATIFGTLIAAPQVSSEKSKLLIDVSSVLIPISERTVDGRRDNAEPSWRQQDLRGLIELGMRGVPPTELTPGAALLARAKIGPPKRYLTPGSFDYPTFLARHAIYTTGWISSPSLLHIVSPPSAAPLLTRIRTAPERIRHAINRFLDSKLSEPEAGTYKALLTGDRSSLAPEVLERFQAIGAYHLLAISGLHMGLIALGSGIMISFALHRANWLLLHASTWKLSALLTAPLLISYAFIAGMQLPVLRALIMSTLVLAAILFDRQHHLPTTISLAALFFLVINPDSLFTASFQLSFAAVISMATLLPTLGRKWKSAPELVSQPVTRAIVRFFLDTILVSTVVFVGILPLLLFHFNRFSPLAAIATIVLEPLLCLWALPFGLSAVPLFAFAPNIAALLLAIGALGLQAAIRICDHLASLPWATIWLPSPDLWQILLYYLVLLALIYARNAWQRLVCCLLMPFLLLAPVAVAKSHAIPQHDSVTILDVGQGNAVVVGVADAGYALIDGGGPFSRRFDIGKDVIARWLWQQRIMRLRTIIISHPDSDHYSGIPFLLEQFRPQELWINGRESEGEAYLELLHQATAQGVTIRVPEAGQTILAGTRSRLGNIAALHQVSMEKDDNDKSLVLRFETRKERFLFPGDIGMAAEQHLIATGEDLRADVLLLAHHGSATSSSQEFLQAVAPRWGVISAGKYRPDTFPAPEVVKRCRNQGVKITTTATDGTISFFMTPHGMQTKHPALAMK